MGRAAKCLGGMWVAAVVGIVCGVVPWLIYELKVNATETHVVAWAVAGLFVCLAVPLTIWDAAQHMRHWHNPLLQPYIVRIMWMVPIYAVDSWLALRFMGIAIYFDTALQLFRVSAGVLAHDARL